MKNSIFKLFLFLLLAVVSTPVFSETNTKVEATRKCVKEFYDSQTYVKEKTNRNDGVEIDAYFHRIGLKSLDNATAAHRRWCGAFQANAWLNCKVKIPFAKYPAYLASVDTWNKAVKYQVVFTKADTGDVISFKFRHVEAVYERHPNPAFPYFTSCGGNTSAPKGSNSNKEGVWKKTRMWREVARVISLEKVLTTV